MGRFGIDPSYACGLNDRHLLPIDLLSALSSVAPTPFRVHSRPLGLHCFYCSNFSSDPLACVYPACFSGVTSDHAGPQK